MLDSRSRLYPDSERTMGFDVGSTGLRIVLDAAVPEVIGRYVREDVEGFLDAHGLTIDDIGWWVCHPGGPKVIEALAGDARPRPRGRRADLAVAGRDRQPVLGLGAARPRGHPARAAAGARQPRAS